MVRTLILTPNKQETCGMYQLAKDLAKELDADILTLKYKNRLYQIIHPFPALETEPDWNRYDTIITFLYPVHKYGPAAQIGGIKWICYDQGIPPATKKYFPNFWRRQYIKLFSYLNRISMKGADKYWDVTKREQKPRWTKRTDEQLWIFQGCYNQYFNGHNSIYALYIGRIEDYKNFGWLWRVMKELKIPFVTPPDNCNDEDIHKYYSHAKLLVTASLWEGYGRPVMEAEALGIPAVAYDVGAHKQHIKKGICVPVGDEKRFKQAVVEVWNR